MKRIRIITPLFLLLGLLFYSCGCGGGGSTVDAISGAVMVPGGAALLTRALDAAAGVPVTLGTMNDDGTVFTALPGASTTTNAQGRYTIPLPAGITPNPRLNVVVGSTLEPLLASIAIDRVTDIRPASAAARESLYTLARASNTPISSLNHLAVRSFLSSAISAGQTAETGNSVTDAIDASATAIRDTAAVKTALQAVMPIAPTALSPTRLSPQFGVVGRTVRVTISGYGLSPAPTITANANPAKVTASVISAAATSLVVDFVIAADAAPGFHYFTMRRVVQGSADQTAGIALYVRSLTASPILTSITPSAGNVSATLNVPVNVTLTGTGFNVPGATVYFTAGAIRVSNVHVVSETTITATFTIPASHAVGNYLAVVQTTSGDSGGCQFTVAQGGGGHVTPPTLTSITPNTYTIQAGGAQSQQVSVHLTGTLFQNGLKVAPYLDGPCYFTNVRNVTATGCDATLVIDKAFGTHDVEVRIINQDSGVSAPPLIFHTQ
jgi:hypothetical protein